MLLSHLEVKERRDRTEYHTPNAIHQMTYIVYRIPSTYQYTGVRAETQSKVRLSTAQQINHTQRGACYVRASMAANV